MEIARGIDQEEWHRLNLTDPDSKDWIRAIEIFEKRISERYIEPADKLVEFEKNLRPIEKKYGFVILAIDCMLIETFQSFYDGEKDTKGKSEEMFRRFLTQRASFKPHFTTILDAENFYSMYRCGILHQSETKLGARVWSIGELIRQDGNGDLIINRTAFHNAIKIEFQSYINILKDKSIIIERKNFINKMNFISRK